MRGDKFRSLDPLTFDSFNIYENDFDIFLESQRRDHSKNVYFSYPVANILLVMVIGILTCHNTSKLSPPWLMTSLKITYKNFFWA